MYIDTHIYIHPNTYVHMYINTIMQTDRKTQTQTDGQIDRNTHTHTDRHTNYKQRQCYSWIFTYLELASSNKDYSATTQDRNMQFSLL